MSDCDERTILRLNALAVPVGKPVHLQIEAEAGTAPANFWVELTQKKAPKALKARELISLKPKERRSFEYTVDLPQGSAGVEARLGLATKKDYLVLHQLVVFHGEKLPDAPLPTTSRDAGE